MEATWLGRYEPYSSQKVSSFIYEMMIANNQQQLADEYNMNPFDVLVLDVKRTICEKIMSLVRFSYTENPIEDLNNKIRHCYDINQLLKNESVNTFANSVEFDKMLLMVANDDKLSFKSNNSWLNNHPKDALIFKDTDKIWNEIEDTYNGDFKQLVYGIFPEGEEILGSLQWVANRLKSISWDIKV